MTMAQTRKAISSYLPTALQKVLHRLFPFILILVIVVVGIPPFVRALIRDLSVLKSLRRTRETFFGSAFPVIAPVFDWLYRPYKIPVLSQAHGVVLDVGSGTGTNLHYLSPAKISKLILVEPNPGMHPKLRENVRAAGFKEGQYVICDCGAQEEDKILEKAGIDKGEVDTVVSVFALCSIPDPKNVIASLYSYLKPGTGQFIFFEHCQSHEPSTVAFQNRLTPFWRFLFFGCELNRPTHKWITEGHEYSEVYVEGIPGQNPFLIDPKRYGWARKV